MFPQNSVPRDGNRIPVLSGVSSSDLKTVLAVAVDPATNRLLVSSSGGAAGTQYAELATTAPGTGTLALGRYKLSAPTLTDGQLYGLQLDSSGNLKVTGSLSVGGTTDNTAFTAGTSTGTPAMGFYHSTIDTVTDGRSAAIAIDSKRNLFTVLRDAAGNARGVNVTASNALLVDGSAVTQPISGTITAAQATAASLNATVVGTGTFAVQAGQSGTWNVTNVSGTVSLPTGASTAAKQPALGTAGTASADVITVQGIASMTALKTDGSGVTQPVSGTVTANMGTTNGLALDATLTGGTQQTKLTDGSNAVGVLKSDGTAGSQNAIMSASAFLSVPFTTSTVQAVGSTDAGNYRYVSVHITTQGGSSTVTFQSSNDNTNWISTALNFSTSVATIPASSTTSAAVIYGGALTGRYFRLNVTGIASGTTAGTIVFSAQPTVPMVVGAQAAQTGTWTVGSNSATGSAVPANAFYTGGVNASGNLVGLATIDRPNDAATGTAILAAGGYIYNGTTFDRTRSIINATNSTGTGIQASGLVGQFDDVSPTAITENQFGNVRMSANRNLYNTIRDAAGNERGVNVTAQNAAVVEGSTASGSSLVGSPVTTGGLAKTANPTAVSDGQVVNNLHDKLGKQVVVGSIRDLKGNQFTTITSSTSETTIVTAVASTFLDVYGVIVENTSATASKVTFKDSTAGTTQFEIYVPAGDTRGFMLPESGAFKQTTVNTNWTATCGTSVSSVVISMLYVKNI